MLKEFFSKRRNRKEQDALWKELNRIEKLLPSLEKHPLRFNENMLVSMMDAIYNSAIVTFIETVRSHLSEESLYKMSDLLDKWDSQVNTKSIDENAFKEFKKDIDDFSIANSDMFTDGWDLTRFFEVKIWEPFFLEPEKKAKELSTRMHKLIQLKDDKKTLLSARDCLEVTPFEFEKMIEDLFKKMGYETELTSRIGDYGIDVIARNNKDVIAIQVKRYSKGNNVGNQEVQKLLGAMQLRSVKANKAVLVTTSDFTIQATEQAKETPIELWDGKYVSHMLKKYEIIEY